MSEVRSPLAPSLSFSSASSATSPTARPQKRRVASSDLQFFTPAASSFKPRPYAPNNESQVKTSSRSHTRSQDALGIPPLGMDPQPSDPHVLFVHPPYNVFPDSHLYPDGLSYPLMAENPEWFLDPNDFISPNNPNPLAIPYPPHLEPPRGWCPAKKKDLKERGAEGWPEGEEPRLRCTFCRRTYAGVNAKNVMEMIAPEVVGQIVRKWLTSECPGANQLNSEENRQMSSTKILGDAHETVVNLDVALQAGNRNTSHRSRFRSLPATEQASRRRERDRSKIKEDAAASPCTDFDDSVLDEDGQAVQDLLAQSHSSSHSPPLTPDSSCQISATADIPPDTSDLTQLSSPLISLPVIPPSPYDPLLTPSFRHSSPRRPSEQPWRFPSPSHPLHSRSRNLSLSVLIRGMNSPLTKSSPTTGDIRVPGISPFASPPVFGIQSRSGILDLDSPAKSLKSPLSVFCKGRSSLASDRMNKLRTIEESPLSYNYREAKGHKRSISDLNDDWLTGGPLDTLAILSGNDPFASIWNSVNANVDIDDDSKNIADADVVSPVLRSADPLPSGVGLGIGLLDPFTLSEDGVAPSGPDSDFDGVSLYPPPKEDDATSPCRVLAASSKENQAGFQRESTPPTKKRKTAID
ncbi:hypothetical protein AX17_000086 [Amanita inopinata Kibby_2008]|nr:hypothetical protein AX17_000086 [Amanita inopinata Kibby_2008]